MRNITELKRRVRRRQRLQGVALIVAFYFYYFGPLVAGCTVLYFFEGPLPWILVGYGIAWIIANIVVGVMAGSD